MKNKLLQITTLALWLVVLGLQLNSVRAADASPAVLAQSTKNGNTTVITVARFGADPTVTAEGTVPVTIYPRVTVIDSTGAVISEKFDSNGSFITTLSPQLVAAILTEIKAAYDADVAAKAEAAAKAAKAAQEAPKTTSAEYEDTANLKFAKRQGALVLRDDGIAISSGGKIYLTPEARTRLVSN